MISSGLPFFIMEGVDNLFLYQATIIGNADKCAIDSMRLLKQKQSKENRKISN